MFNAMFVTGIIMCLFLAAMTISVTAASNSSTTSTSTPMFLPYGNLCYDPANSNVPDPENPDTVWVRAVYLALLGKPTTYDQFGQPIYHMKGKFEFKIYDGSKCISIKDSGSYFPNGINVSNAEANTNIHLPSGLFARLSKVRQNNLDIVILKDGKQVGTRKLDYHENANVKIDSIRVSGKNVQVILNSNKKNYLLKDAVWLDIKNSNGDVIKDGYLIQPKFDKNGKYNCPSLKLDSNTNGKLTVYLYESFMGEQPYDVNSWSVDQRTILSK